MTDYTPLEAAAKRAVHAPSYTYTYPPELEGWYKFVALANPATILELLAELKAAKENVKPDWLDPKAAMADAAMVCKLRDLVEVQHLALQMIYDAPEIPYMRREVSIALDEALAAYERLKEEKGEG